MDENLKEIHDRFVEEMRYVDEVAQVIIKGHLVLEEVITRIIEKFLFHPIHLEKIQFGFYQKVELARSMSLDESESGIWDLILAINSYGTGFGNLTKASGLVTLQVVILVILIMMVMMI